MTSGETSEDVPLIRRGRFMTTGQLNNAVFDGTAGGTTFRTYGLLLMLALTDPRLATQKRPRGSVFGGEEFLAGALRSSHDTVGRSLGRLRQANLLVMVRDRDGHARRAREFLVAEHAVGAPQRLRIAMTGQVTHPVFDGPAGGTRFRIYCLLCQRARTDAGREKSDRPLGWTPAGEESLAGELRLSPQLVSRALRQLMEAGLIVLWAERDCWAGRAREYLVAEHARPSVLGQLAVGRNLVAPTDQPCVVSTDQPCVVSTDQGCGDNQTLPAETVALRPLKTRVGVTPTSSSPPMLDLYDNHIPYVAMANLITGAEMAPVPTKTLAGAAHVISAHCDTVAGVNAAAAAIVELFATGVTLAEATRDYFGISIMDYWRLVEEAGCARRDAM